jgi:nitrite reductase/ring-hydroxylating ferredoxin subunit
MPRYVVASVSDIPPGTRKLVQVNGRPVAIFNLEGAFFGLNNKCPHEGGSLCHGVVTGLIDSTGPGEYHQSRRGEMIRCPWHGWEFDIQTGQSWCDPERMKVRRYGVDVAHGSDLVEGPYVAETIAVTVEDDYVVVDV